MADGSISIIAKPHPFDCETIYCEAKAGMTIAQMLGEGASQAVSVTVDGYDVPSALWARVKPKAGRTIHIVLYPQSGSAGKYIRLVAMVVLTIFAPYIARPNVDGRLSAPIGWHVANRQALTCR